MKTHLALKCDKSKTETTNYDAEVCNNVLELLLRTIVKNDNDLILDFF